MSAGGKSAGRILSWDAGTAGELCWEDFAPGQVFPLGRHEMARDQIVEFATRYDPQAFHLDEEAGRQSLLRGQAASGWHTCAALMRMLGEGLLARSRYRGLQAVDEIKWRRPVRPGDVLTGRAACIGRNIGSAGPGLGSVGFHCEALDAGGEPVMSWHAHLVFERRSSGATAPATVNLDRHSTVVRNPGNHRIKFFEDLDCGDEIELGPYRFATDEALAFRRDFDNLHPHPLAAGDRLAVSNWQVLGGWMNRLVAHYERAGAELRAMSLPVPRLGPSPGLRSLRWQRPVYAEDVVAFTCWAERKSQLPAVPGWGLLLAGGEGRNQSGELVVRFVAQLLLERRQEADEAQVGSPSRSSSPSEVRSERASRAKGH